MQNNLWIFAIFINVAILENIWLLSGEQDHFSLTFSKTKYLSVYLFLQCWKYVITFGLLFGKWHHAIYLDVAQKKFLYPGSSGNEPDKFKLV